MDLPVHIMRDIETVCTTLGDHVVHYGIFGSAIDNDFLDINDVDVLWVYTDITFDEICAALQDTNLRMPFVCSYMNYSSRIASPPNCTKYYHFVFMPENKPNRDFMARHEGKIVYFTQPFDSWRRRAVTV